ncbi:MAG: Glycerol-1-phosphate dehydrogenase (NAD(P)+) [candidate division WS2 bacterium ADurb.Bin280]|uniref:Glycerol-1-phosphate dehydrogenase (NAD(P)+) n=1 Tax=candidate division WS2 bacterium ADurb.Bin280 TaxID=1852829 RepID=A0A1V5SEN5_9BACT|nr:MAG: Glycerol-1-phosphate dehydrogenase (NAD(P)+) [candidate division WS2 bacterium ADurb.Bin280]
MLFNSNIVKQDGLSKKIIENVNKDDLFLYSQTSLDLVDDYEIDKASAINRKEVGINRAEIESFAEKGNFSRIISLGNGQTSDIAKYISYIKKIPHICIPSIFSTNVSFTDKSCLKEGEVKKTFQSKPPETVVIDYDLISRSNFSYHYYGLCDILSIYTALEDWKISSIDTGEHIDDFCYNIAETLIKILEKQLPIILCKSRESLDAILNLVVMSGYITNIYGSGRPESGSEHIFSKELESKIDIFHAISVSIGALIMSKLQNKNHNIIRKLVDDLGLLQEAEAGGVTRDLISSALIYANKNRDRYTVLNRADIDEKKANELISEIFEGYIFTETK